MENCMRKHGLVNMVDIVVNMMSSILRITMVDIENIVSYGYCPLVNIPKKIWKMAKQKCDFP